MKVCFPVPGMAGWYGMGLAFTNTVIETLSPPRPKVRPVPTAQTERWSSPANLASLVRLPLAVVPWIWMGNRTVVVAAIAAAAVSDGLDGFLARLHQRDLLVQPKRRIGEWLDPLCDKTFMVSVTAAAWYAFSLPLWLVALVLSREILLSISAAVRWIVPCWRRTLGTRLKAALIGKAATAAQFFTLIVLFWDSSMAIAPAVMSGVLGALSAGYYFHRTIASKGGIDGS